MGRGKFIGGFIFQFGALAKRPTRDQKAPGAIPAKVIFKVKQGGARAETLLAPMIHMFQVSKG